MGKRYISPVQNSLTESADLAMQAFAGGKHLRR